MIHERRTADATYEFAGNQPPHHKITKAVSVVRSLHLLPFFPIHADLELEVRDGRIPLDVINDLASGSVTSDRVIEHFFKDSTLPHVHQRKQMSDIGKRRQIANLNRKIELNEARLWNQTADYPLNESMLAYQLNFGARIDRQIAARDRLHWSKK